MPTVSRLYLGFGKQGTPERYLDFFKNKTGLLYMVRVTTLVISSPVN